MKNRILCMILALLMAAPSLAACSESQVNTENEVPSESSASVSETAVVESTEELSDYDQRQLIPDNLPAETFGGEEFRIMTYASTEYLSELMSEELNGDACNDAVYNRNIDVEDRFEVKITVVEAATPEDQVKVFATAGTDDAHVVGFKNYKAYTPITAGALMNWIEAPYQDLSQPWHNKLANDGSTLNNILYAICSDLSITSMTYTYATFVNSGLLTDFGYSVQGLYDTVKEGKWTIDKMIEMTDNMYLDNNGDQKRDKDDTYGFGYEITNPADVWLTASGGKVSEFNGNEVVLTFMNDKTVALLEKLVDWHYNHPGFYIYPVAYDEEIYFMNEKLVMAPLRFAAAYNKLRDMEAVYTMIPYPKWNEEQEAYYTNADDKFTAFGLPITSANSLEFVSIIYEALCAESYKQVFPAYYDQALKGKYSSDATTAEMVDLIIAGRAFDFAFQFGESCFQMLCYRIREMLRAQNANLASSYKSMEKVLSKTIPRILNKAYNLD